MSYLGLRGAPLYRRTATLVSPPPCAFSDSHLLVFRAATPLHSPRCPFRVYLATFLRSHLPDHPLRLAIAEIASGYGVEGRRLLVIGLTSRRQHRDALLRCLFQNWGSTGGVSNTEGDRDRCLSVYLRAGLLKERRRGGGRGKTGEE